MDQQKKPLESKLCPFCGKVPILVVNRPQYTMRLGMKLEIRALEACDPCYYEFLQYRGSPGAGFWFV